MSKIVITGSKGTIGTVVAKGLARNHEVVGLNLPEHDISDYESLLGQVRGADAVIHLAHSMVENDDTGKIDPINVRLEMNVFQAVIEAKVPRLIMASSVHADDFNSYDGDELLTVPGSHGPGSPYGAHKLIAEEIGRFYSAHHGFEFIGIRLGGVFADNSVDTNFKEPAVWLSHHDLLAAVEACISAADVPGKFAVFYAVSDNEGRLHDTSNPFGWAPEHNSRDYL